MRPTPRRLFEKTHRLTVRLRAKRRGGFTLVEMMVSVTLILLMMMMFAEIYGLAQETISTQKGVATNNQKARILAEVLREDLETRTFRDVYPFKTELQFDGTDVTPTIPSGPTAAEQDRLLREERRGYFSYSENDPANDSDDVLQFTVDVSDSGHQIYGLATIIDANGDNVVDAADLPFNRDFPEFDDGRQEGSSGASSMAEVSYYLRYGNLYRSVLLIREPYQSPPPPANPTWGATTPAAFPPDVTNFWGKFDYSAYRESPSGGVKFHGPSSLSNNSSDDYAPFNLPTVYPPPAFPTIQLFLPRSLGVPQLRFGHSLTIHGQPIEFGTTYDSSMFSIDANGNANGTVEPADWAAWKTPPRILFSRFHAQERSSSAMDFPGQTYEPFAVNEPVAVDGDADNAIDFYQDGPRRGVDLMLANVHSFDVQVWDDVVGDYVDLGHSRTGMNPYTRVANQEGFYHISRLRTAVKAPAAGPFQRDYPSTTDPVLPNDFGNRYDTWNPSMFIQVGSDYYRTGRAPYRPLKMNPNPNAAAYITPGGDGLTYEQRVAFGDKTLDDNQDGVLGGAGDTDAEAPLRAVRIVVRYLDVNSGLTRQATIEQSLVD